MKTKFNNRVNRDFLIYCRSNRGGKHLVPETIVEIKVDPVTQAYSPIGEPSPYFGEIRARLEKRGHLVQTASGLDRITRGSAIGKSVRKGRNRRVFVQVRVDVPKWILFTKRTNSPKLDWLLDTCEAAGLRVEEHGRSFHAPITYVHRDDHDAAWAILNPVDDVPDDDDRWTTAPATA